MSELNPWWILAGLAIGIELLTGTFYLLMLSTGFIAAALAAMAGYSMPVQLILAALVSGSATLTWRAYKTSHPVPQASANHDVNLDIGEIVYVNEWAADGSAKTQYRGAQWSVALAPGEAMPEKGAYRIAEVVGNRLILKKD